MSLYITGSADPKIDVDRSIPEWIHFISPFIASNAYNLLLSEIANTVLPSLIGVEINIEEIFFCQIILPSKLTATILLLPIVAKILSS